MARLVSAMTGERYCLAGVGKDNDWQLPVGSMAPFTLQELVGKKLFLLQQTEHGTWGPITEDDGGYVESPAPVAGFVSPDNEVRVYGSLQGVMDEHGWVQVQFGEQPLQESSYDAPLMDLSGISTPPTPKKF